MKSVGGSIRRQSSKSLRIDKPYSVTNTSQALQSEQRPSVFARLGDNPVSGTPVEFDNLDSTVTKEDIKDLCESLGEIRNVSLKVSESNPKKFTGEVHFARRSVAIACVEKFNGVKLDGAPMVVKLKGAHGQENPFNPSLKEKTNVSNVRRGIFGSAINTLDDSSQAPATNNIRFTVKLGDESSPRVTLKRNPAKKSVSKSGGGGRAKLTEAQLDSELDKYIKR
jgi:RNA recognition motif-containing protein